MTAEFEGVSIREAGSEHKKRKTTEAFPVLSSSAAVASEMELAVRPKIKVNRRHGGKDKYDLITIERSASLTCFRTEKETKATAVAVAESEDA